MTENVAFQLILQTFLNFSLFVYYLCTCMLATMYKYWQECIAIIGFVHMQYVTVQYIDLHATSTYACTYFTRMPQAITHVFHLHATITHACVSHACHKHSPKYFTCMPQALTRVQYFTCMPQALTRVFHLHATSTHACISRIPAAKIMLLSVIE